MQALSDEALQAKTAEFKERVAEHHGRRMRAARRRLARAGAGR